MPTIVGVPRETFPNERRAALIPRQCDALRKAGVEIVVEHEAGAEAGFPDDAYAARGARLANRNEVFRESDIIAQVRCLGANPDAGRLDLPLLRAGRALGNP